MRIALLASLVPQPEGVARVQRELAEKLAAIPGVDSVGFANSVPMDGITGFWDAIRVEGQPRANELPPLRIYKTISPGLFATVGTKQIAGRDYTWTDLSERRRVVMMSENLARELWGSSSAAIGKRISAGGPLHEVIGVVQDVHDRGVQEPAPPTVYWPSTGEEYFPAPNAPRRNCALPAS